MKIYITSTVPIGKRCLDWAKNNLPGNIELVSNMEECEFFFSIFYNKLVSKEFINSKIKCFNFHGGILPYYRGSGVFNWTIINEEKETGITLHEIDERIDHGSIIDIQTFPIIESDTTEDLFKKAEKTIFELFQKWFVKLLNGDYSAMPQDDKKAKLYKRADLQAVKDISKFARAFHTPGYEQAYYYNYKGEKIYLKW